MLLGHRGVEGVGSGRMQALGDVMREAMAGSDPHGDVLRPAGVLIVDDDPIVYLTVTAVLAGLDRPVFHATSHAAAERIVEQGFRGVVLLDLGLPEDDGRPERDGLLLVEPLRRRAPDNPIIVLTSKDDLASIVAAMKSGVQDFLVKGSQGFIERLEAATRMALAEFERAAARERAPRQDRLRAELIFASASMHAVLADIERLGNSKVSVLIQGPSGTGKEVVAHAIHEGGNRRGGPFVAVNCAGIPDTLLESELLGYERGAFTGALARKAGKFEAADGGTIFFDEIGEMSLPLQAKLLRLLQDGGFERLGGNTTVSVDVRVISATNRDLAAKVQAGTFREDLYYRLAVFTLQLPSLRDRPEDIEPLSMHFLRRACQDERKPLLRLPPEVLRLLQSHPWPGNVRQLQNVIKHAVVVAQGPTLTIGDMPDSFISSIAAVVASGAVLEQRPIRSLEPPRRGHAGVAERLDTLLDEAFPDSTVLPTMDDLEAAGIRLAMKRLEGNRKQSAERLQISRATLYRRIDPVAPRGRRRSGVSGVAGDRDARMLHSEPAQGEGPGIIRH